MTIINHEYYVSLETAKLLKEVGFNWKVEFFYQNGILKSVLPDVLFNDNFEDIEYYYKHIGIPHYSLNYNGGSSKFLEEYSAPTLTIAQRWLREVKNVWIEVLLVNATSPHYRVDLVNASRHNNPYGILHDADYKAYETPEQAQEAGITKALEIILEKGE